MLQVLWLDAFALLKVQVKTIIKEGDFKVHYFAFGLSWVFLRTIIKIDNGLINCIRIKPFDESCWTGQCFAYSSNPIHFQ